MKRFFIHKIASENLFCRRCKGISSHSLLAREPICTRGLVPKGIPLLCVCDACQTSFIAFTHEFAFFNAHDDNQNYAKILGRSRLIPGDWLYVKGQPRPGKIKGIFHTATEEIINVSYGEDSDEKIVREYSEASENEPNYGYRLLPVQCAQTLIGDPVYHVLRDQFGKAVGVVNDGEKEKLAVLLEDETLVFITLPESEQTLPNPRLREIVNAKMGEAFPDIYSSLHIDVGQGVVYIQGTVPNFPLRREISRFLANLPMVRGNVDFLRVEPPHPVSDENLGNAALAILEDPASVIFNYSITVQGGRLQLKALYIHENSLIDIEKRFGQLEGLRDLSLLLEQVPQESMSMRQLCLSVGHSLRENSRMKDSCIQVSAFDNALILEGRVQSILQKNMAFFLAKISTKKITIINHLRIVHE